MTALAVAAQARSAGAADPTLASFGHEVWWLILLKVGVIFAFLMLTTLFMIWAERRVIGRMQQRPGPNRAGKFGLLQSLLDGLKLPLKEDIVPRGVDKVLFWMAPAIALIPAFISFAIIPVGPVVSIFHHHTALQLTDLPVAVLLVLAMSSMAVYGIVLAGWASASPYSLLGGLRSSAQVISYEIAMGLSFVPVFLYAGSLSTSQIVAAQAHGGEFHLGGVILHYPSWFAILLLPSFVIYLVTMVGETNRLPFDLPEGEGELVGRLPHRVLLAEVRVVLPGRVHQHGHRLGPGHHAVPGRLAGAVADLGVAGRQHRLVAGAVVPGQDRGLAVLLHLAARLAAPDPLRPADGAGLEGPHPERAGLDADDRDGPGLAAPRQQPRGLPRGGRDRGGADGPGLGLGQRVHGPGQGQAAEDEAAAEAEAAGQPGPASPFPVPPLDLPHYHGIGVGVRSGAALAEPAESTTKEVTGA